MRTFAQFHKAMLLVLFGGFCMHCAYGDPTSEPPTQKPPKARILKASRTIRAQSPASESASESYFDDKLTANRSDASVFDGRLPACGTVPAAPNCPDLPSVSIPNPASAPVTEPAPGMGPLPDSGLSPATPEPAVPSLSAGQGSLTAQSNAPAWFGDFFNGGGNNLTAPGSFFTHNGVSYPFAQAITTNGGSTYFQSLGIITNPAAGPPVGPTLLQPSGLYPSHPYSVPLLSSIGSSIAYQDGYGAYQEPSAAHPTGGPLVAAQNISLVTNTPQLVATVPASFFTNEPTVGTLVSADPHHPLPIVSTGNHGTSTAYYSGSYTQNGQTYYFVPIYIATNAVNINVVSPSVGANGVQKLVDNASPLPRNRVFFNYNYFDNTTQIVNGQSVNVQRITPGFEKTFFDQRMSIEVRVPFATNISNIDLTGYTNTNDIQLGNQTTYLKGLIYTDSQLAISGGAGLQLPTASGTTLFSNNYPIVNIKNEAVHLLPFLGAVYTPNDRFYAQSVTQFDFATNGNSVSTAAIYPSVTPSGAPTFLSTGMQPAGILNDTNFVYLSGNAGYWIYKSQDPYKTGFTGIAPTVELHYNQSLQRSDVVQGPYGNVSSPINNISNVNGVVGVNTVIGYNKYLSAAYVAPLTTGENRFFDGEFRVMFNYYFGAPRVNPRFSNVPGQ